MNTRYTLHPARRLAAAAALAGLAALAATAPGAARAGTVTLSGELTSFQSALGQNVDPRTGQLDPTKDGDGTLNGQRLAIDPNVAPVRYPNAFNLFFPQSTTVTLAPGTQRAQFEYNSFIGTPDASPNVIEFTAAGPADVNVGDTFRIGSISYTNGFWFPAARIGLTVTTHSADAALDNKTFVGTINVDVTNLLISNTDPAANADYFTLSDASTGLLTSLGSVRVYERQLQPAGNPGNTGSVDLYARIGSLIPQRFDHPSGGAFLSSSVVPAVPEPGTALLALLGLAGLAGWQRRRAADS